MFKNFSVKCTKCGHNNRPHKSPTEGIKSVLSGSFRKCNHCGTEFTSIQVPNRPLVQQLMRTLPIISTTVKIVGYIGKVPRARGLIG